MHESTRSHSYMYKYTFTRRHKHKIQLSFLSLEDGSFRRRWTSVAQRVPFSPLRQSEREAKEPTEREESSLLLVSLKRKRGPGSKETRMRGTRRQPPRRERKVFRMHLCVLWGKMCN